MNRLRLSLAFVWLHWKQQLNALRGRRRSSFVRTSAWIQLLIRVVVGLVFFTAAASAVVGGYFAGTLLCQGGDPRRVTLAILRVLLGFFTVLAIFLPVIRAGQGSLPGTERLLLLPLARRDLHALETWSFVSDPWLLVLLPGFFALGVGSLPGGPVAAGLALLSGLLFLALLGILAAALTFFVRLLLRDRRRAEAVILAFFLGVIALSLLPAVLETSGKTGNAPSQTSERAPGVELSLPGDEGTGAAAGGASGDLAAADRFPWFLQLLPSEALVRSLARATAGSELAALPSISLLLFLAAGIWILSRLAWTRLTSTPATTSSRRGNRELPNLWALPFLSHGTRSVAGVLVKTTLRTVQGKIILILPTLMILVLAVVGKGRAGPLGGALQGPSLFLVASLFAVSSLQNVLLNQFGIDGSGLTLQFLAPLTDRQMVRGKALGGAALTASTLLPALIVVLLYDRSLPILLAPAALFAALATYALFYPVAAWLSLLFPKTGDLSKMGQEGKPKPAAALLGFLGLVVVFVLPSGAGVLGFLAGRAIGALLAEGLVAVIAVLLSVAFIPSVTAGLRLRREGILLAMREG